MDSNLCAPSRATPETELHALTNYQETAGIQLTGTIPKQELRPHPAHVLVVLPRKTNTRWWQTVVYEY